MKHKKLLAVIVFTVILVSSIAGVIVAAYLGPAVKGNFALTASGQGYDSNHKVVLVTLTITGSVTGSAGKTIALHVKDGQATVAGYSPLSIRTGETTLFHTNNDYQVNMNLVLTQGGRSSPWNLDGRATGASIDKMSVTLNDDKLTLPVNGNPIITQIYLTGQITINRNPSS